MATAAEGYLKVCAETNDLERGNKEPRPQNEAAEMVPTCRGKLLGISVASGKRPKSRVSGGNLEPLVVGESILLLRGSEGE